MWKIVEKVVPNLNTPITWKLSERRGRLCDVLSLVPGAVGNKCYHIFKWHAIRLFNSLPQHLRNLTNCSVHMFKNRLCYHSLEKRRLFGLLATTLIRTARLCAHSSYCL